MNNDVANSTCASEVFKFVWCVRTHPHFVWVCFCNWNYLFTDAFIAVVEMVEARTFLHWNFVFGKKRLARYFLDLFRNSNKKKWWFVFKNFNQNEFFLNWKKSLVEKILMFWYFLLMYRDTPVRITWSGRKFYNVK